MNSERWQRLQNLFHDACELGEPARSHFLNNACAGDPILLGQLELLLSQEEDAKTFIESSAVEVAGAALATDALEHGEGFDLVGKTVSHYEILEKLGAGGMGVVYKARDTSLGRFVALKFLPHVEGLLPLRRGSEYDASENSEAKRFLREARAASALDHPNICTVYEVGQYKGAPFIAMQYLAGRPLSEEINGKPCPLTQTLKVGIQIADALVAAHKAGIVHRDIKPANIFLLADRQEAKILDFGLARAIPAHAVSTGTTDSQSQPLVASMAGRAEFDPGGPSTALGTLAYLSPEQVRGEELDARSDLFSFGVMLYEMATGRLPFEEETAEATLHAILHNTHPAPSTLNPQLPRAIDPIIDKTLAKDRDHRYQTASALRDDLASLQQELSIANRAPSTRFWPKVFALAMILLVAVSLVAYRFARWRLSRHLGSDTIVLADFSNTTGDPVFDETLKQALRVQLEQSPSLHVLSDQQVSQQLKLMRRPETEPLTRATAQEVCVRSGGNVVLSGAISRLGSQYVLGINAIRCTTGDSLASEQSFIGTREKVLHSLVDLAHNLREKLGESPASINKYNAPLEQATTSSLEALQDYSFALKTWHTKGEEAAIPFFKRATELDPEFVMAWARLGNAYFNLGKDTNAFQALSKAYSSRERVSEPEKFYIESRYYRMVTHEYEKTLQVDELWRQIYPRDVAPYLGSATAYATAGQHNKSLEMETQALELEPENGFIYANLAFIYINLDRFDKAQEILDQAKKRNIYNPWFESVRYQLGFLKHDTEQMRQAVTAVEDRPSLQSFFLALQADTEAYQGHLAKARALTRSAVESARRNNDVDSADGYQVAGVLREVEFGIRERALREVHTLVAAGLHHQSRVLAALALARAGDSPSALAIVDDLNRQFPSDTLLNTYWLPTIRAAAALSRHSPSTAIQLLQPVIPYEMGLQPNPTFLVPYPAYLRGLAYLEEGQGAQAAAEFRKIPEHAGLVLNCPLGALASLELGRAYALEGGVAILGRNLEVTRQVHAENQQPAALDDALKSYEQFLAVWKQADPDIPVLKQAKMEYARLK
jgi:eukaryotic-like serine/threonine-protein kinase